MNVWFIVYISTANSPSLSFINENLQVDQNMYDSVTDALPDEYEYPFIDQTATHNLSVQSTLPYCLFNHRCFISEPLFVLVGLYLGVGYVRNNQAG